MKRTIQWGENGEYWEANKELFKGKKWRQSKKERRRNNLSQKSAIKGVVATRLEV